MAGPRGPAPKDPDKRQRRNADTLPSTELPVDARVTTPPACPAGEWLPATERWWNRWARSPQATLFVDTDWQRLEMLLPLVDQYMSRPAPSSFAEIVRSETLLGATVADRLRMRVRLKSDEPDPAAERAAKAVKRRRDPRKAALRAVK